MIGSMEAALNPISHDLTNRETIIVSLKIMLLLSVVLSLTGLC